MSQSEKYSQIRKQSQALADSLGKLVIDAVGQGMNLVNVVSEDGLKVAADARNMGTALVEGVVNATLTTVETISEESGNVSEGKA
jgi:hypothetical protein|tara:strand:+ start:312 stop:566 length:255 start_codon:yes stop_codon:yes gene_type:complete